MIRMDISLFCDSCSKVGVTLGGCRWLPGEHCQKPALPKGWSLFFTEDMGWESLCPECQPVREKK